jgi:hypothetical protein
MSSNSFLGTFAIFQGKQGKYYIIDGCKYDIHFPLEWALTMGGCSGPKYCENCEHFGSINGVFVGYCGNCGMYIYDSNRSHINQAIGYTSEGKFYTSEEQLWIELPYMKGIPITQIGDNDQEHITFDDFHEDTNPSQESGYAASDNISEVTVGSQRESDLDGYDCEEFKNESQDSYNLSYEQIKSYIEEYE